MLRQRVLARNTVELRYSEPQKMQTFCFKGRFVTLKCGHLATVLFHKADRSFSPTSIVQNSLDDVDACMAPTQDCQAPLIDSTTGHY